MLGLLKILKISMGSFPDIMGMFLIESVGHASLISMHEWHSIDLKRYLISMVWSLVGVISLWKFFGEEKKLSPVIFQGMFTQ